MSLRVYLILFCFVGAIIQPISFATPTCKFRLSISALNLTNGNEWMRYLENERSALRRGLQEEGVLGYGDPTLKAYRIRMYTELNELYDGNLIALTKTISAKQLSKVERDPQFNGASREAFFKNLNEWCELKLNPNPNKARIAELEAKLKNEYTMHNSTPNSFQPITADLGNMLTGLAKESEIDSDFPRYGLPALFTVFYKRFLVNPKSPPEENKNVNDFVNRHFSP